MREADAAAGHAPRRLLDEGLTAVDAAVSVRLSRSQVKRLLRVTADPAKPGPAARPQHNTVKNHVTRLLQKLVVRDRARAIVIAYQCDLFER